MVKEHDYDNTNFMVVFLFIKIFIWCDKMKYFYVNSSSEQLYPPVMSL